MSSKDSVYLFTEGNRDKYGSRRFISNTSVVKKIIGIGSENCILATDVLYDYYDGMDYDEFKELILSRGYLISHESPFVWNAPDGHAYKDFQLVAFKKELNIVIIADSIYNKSTFNSIKCYCYGVDSDVAMLNELFIMGSYNCSVFDLVSGKHTSQPLKAVESMAYTGNDVQILSTERPLGYFYSERGVADSDSVRKRFYNSCSSELREYLYC